MTDAHELDDFDMTPATLEREDWASRANYDPGSSNPNRWWNDGRGLPERLD